ncbi:hypothetical protein RF11_10588 [Thelohanellus kitauei]|uniref:Uncharacterized protein n=1 Tax=Thelohanellus kitauei TaxID=669202 RepID=A0A0C2NKI7_THEKT|nr:hypothetical protein RF11_10588 [Thelohanellus kitauei]
MEHSWQPNQMNHEMPENVLPIALKTRIKFQIHPDQSNKKTYRYYRTLKVNATKISVNYDERYIFKADETVRFYKMRPNKILNHGSAFRIDKNVSSRIKNFYYAPACDEEKDLLSIDQMNVFDHVAIVVKGISPVSWRKLVFKGISGSLYTIGMGPSFRILESVAMVNGEVIIEFLKIVI